MKESECECECECETHETRIRKFKKKGHNQITVLKSILTKEGLEKA